MWGGAGLEHPQHRSATPFGGSPRSESLQNSRALWSEMRVFRLISITGDQSITCIFSKVCSTTSLVWAPTTPLYPTPKALVLRSHLASLQVCGNSLAWFSIATLRQSKRDITCLWFHLGICVHGNNLQSFISTYHLLWNALWFSSEFPCICRLSNADRLL